MLVLLFHLLAPNTLMFGEFLHNNTQILIYMKSSLSYSFYFLIYFKLSFSSIVNFESRNGICPYLSCLDNPHITFPKVDNDLFII